MRRRFFSLRQTLLPDDERTLFMKLKIFNFSRAGAVVLALCFSLILPAKAADVPSGVVTIPADGGLASVGRNGTKLDPVKFAYSLVPDWVDWVQAEASYGGTYDLEDSSSDFWTQYWAREFVFTALLAKNTGTLVATFGRESKTIRVTQSAGTVEPNMKSGVRSYRFSVEGGSVDFPVSCGPESTLSWGSSKGADWISLSAIPDNEDEESCRVRLAVEKNASSASREAYVWIVLNEHEKIIALKISQAGTSAPVRGEVARDNPELAGTLDAGELFEQIWLDASGDERMWTLPDGVVGEPFFLDQSWLEGFADGDTLTVSATENSGELRETFVFFRTEDGGVYALFVKQNEE